MIIMIWVFLENFVCHSYSEPPSWTQQWLTPRLMCFVFHVCRWYSLICADVWEHYNCSYSQKPNKLITKPTSSHSVMMSRHNTVCVFEPEEVYLIDWFISVFCCYVGGQYQNESDAALQWLKQSISTVEHSLANSEILQWWTANLLYMNLQRRLGQTVTFTHMESDQDVPSLVVMSSRLFDHVVCLLLFSLSSRWKVNVSDHQVRANEVHFNVRRSRMFTSCPDKDHRGHQCCVTVVLKGSFKIKLSLTHKTNCNRKWNMTTSWCRLRQLHQKNNCPIRAEDVNHMLNITLNTSGSFSQPIKLQGQRSIYCLIDNTVIESVNFSFSFLKILYTWWWWN